MEDGMRVVLTMPADASFVRLARLAAADAGSRAGFTLEEIDDLRIAVGELCVQVMGHTTKPTEHSGTHAMTSLAFAISPGRVDVDGTGPPAPDGDFTEISEAIVSAVTDEHEIVTDGPTRQFRLRKDGAGRGS